MTISTFCAVSLLAWIYLFFLRGGFWKTEERLEPASIPRENLREWPTLAVIIPARNEAPLIPRALPAILGQDYPGKYHLFLVDDNSNDGTARIALETARQVHAEHLLTVIPGIPCDPGWTGKLWALQQGINAGYPSSPDYYLFVDADICLDKGVLASLAYKALKVDADLVSIMAILKVETFWERVLVPAFVYFFAKLYPFRWSNDPAKGTAGAAGGCLLVRSKALEKAGGLQAVKNEIIDDCALAKIIKCNQERASDITGTRARTWLGLSKAVRSIRPYGGLHGVWNMVTRTAFHQLHYSTTLLVLTAAGMSLIYLLPPAGLAICAGRVVLYGAGLGQVITAATATIAMTLMIASYIPMVRWYTVPLYYAPLLPLAALMYTVMTFHSAIKHWLGKGAAWKGRTYAGC